VIRIGAVFAVDIDTPLAVTGPTSNEVRVSRDHS
jgi:hypothetical protein